MKCEKNKCVCYEDNFYDPDTKSCLYKDDFMLKHKIKALGFNALCHYSKSASIPKFCNESENMACIMSHCVCKEGFHVYRGENICLTKKQLIEKYGDKIIAGPLEHCDRKQKSVGISKLCDENANCQNSSCVCSDNFFGNFISNRCEYQNKYTYRVTQGLYCNNDSNCFEGLECHYHKCACLLVCDLVKKFSGCDCDESHDLWRGLNVMIITVSVVTLLIVLCVVFCLHVYCRCCRKGQRRGYQSSVQYNPAPIPPPQSQPPPAYPFPPTEFNHPLNSFPKTTNAGSDPNIDMHAPKTVPIISGGAHPY
ncbi:unnamed protein product [Meganyctiphanes norvegica]|uniref:EB domain-containing protein n=1 Tax=Meganyctiphanes norvegica TaxID=48144 RepID=A0AAV2RMI2_MEGNR